jgi:hypothetical protein
MFPGVYEPMLTDWILVGVTAVLAAVTIFYAIQTWRLVKVNFTPRLNAFLSRTTIRPDQTHGIIIMIENIGNSTALCIKGKYTINKEPTQTMESISSLEPKQSHSIRLELRPIEDREFYENNPTKIKVNLEFKNILKQKDKDKAVLDVSYHTIHASPIDS